MPQTKRILYIDNIRIYLTVIVILHHLAIIYGAPGAFYYREFEYNQLGPITLALLVIFAAGNQAYFMGLFYFLGGFFSYHSLRRKSLSQFIHQRLLRLGIPILIFILLISPLMRFLSRHLLFGQEISIENFALVYTDFEFGAQLGPMWFILLLLLFSLCYALLSMIFPGTNTFKATGITSLGLIVLALVIGCITFLVRIALPIGYVFQPLNLQVPFLPQYIGLYIMGITAARMNWLDRIKQIILRPWLAALLVLLLAMPVLFILSGGLTGDLTPALGGLSWQSLAFAVWEQLFCVSMIITLLTLFRNHLNQQNQFSRELSGNAYAAFIIHAPVLVLFSITIRNLSAPPLIKIVLGAIPVLSLSFLAAGILRRLPLLRKFL